MNVTSRTTFVAVALTSALLTSQTVDAQQTTPTVPGAGHSSSTPAPTIAEAAATPAAGNTPTSGVVDVALKKDGIIRGRVLHADGRPIDGSRVILRQGDRIMAAVISEADGQFSVKGLGSGVYQMETPTGNGTYRFWTAEAAPPSATAHALLVSKEPVMRGQLNMFTPQETLILAVGAAGLGVGIYALNELDDQEGKLNRLANQVSKIPVSP